MKNTINILFKKIFCVIFVTLVVLPGFADDCDVGNTANAILTPSGNITAPDNWPQYLRNNNIVVYTNSTSVKPATGKIDDYIEGQEWSVQFETGIVSGYAACGGNKYKADTTYSYPWSSAFGGCLCSLDKESWYFTEKVSTSTGWENQIVECYEACPYTCAQYVATNSTFRTRLFGSVEECPVVETDMTEYSITYNLDGGSGCSNTTYTGSTTLCTPTHNIYTFAGWTTSVNGSVVYQGGDTISGTNLILYAKWTEPSTCEDCYCPETGTPLTTSEISGLPTWDDMISQGIVTGAGTNYKPASGKIDD